MNPEQSAMVPHATQQTQRWGLYAAVIAVVAAACVTPWLQQPPHPYKRYTSPPLPDGTRYTFLYPRYFHHTLGVKELGQPSDTLQQMGVDAMLFPGPPTLLDRLIQLIPWRHQSGFGRINVMVGLATPRSGRVLSVRKDSYWKRSPEQHHDITIIDARSGLKLTMYSFQNVPSHFAEEDPVISRSFRVIPPGTQPPKD